MASYLGPVNNRHQQSCQACQRRDKREQALESFLQNGLQPPIKRSTNAELWQWIEQTTTTMETLRAALLGAVAHQYLGMAGAVEKQQPDD